MNVGGRGPKWTNGPMLTKLKDKLEKSRDSAFIEGFDGCCNEVRKFVVGAGDLNGVDWGRAGGIVGIISQRWCR